MTKPNPTAAILVIGNEILSGRTQDLNVQYIARGLEKAGIRLAEVQIVPDDQAMIVERVRTLSAAYTYVFTTGGIGDTHDDITAASVAKAFERPVVCHAEAERRLRVRYKDIQDPHLGMANMPEGALLIDNPVTVAPGFILENVYVMAGVPQIMQAMFDGVLPTLKGGEPVHTCVVSAHIGEGRIAEQLSQIQERYPDVEIGSYPYFYPHGLNGAVGVSVVLKGINATLVEDAEEEVRGAIVALGVEPIIGELSEVQ